ncbi:MULTISPECIES: isopenicillin N synthase family oxygenase [unclassified Pseudofrankia]|uniref:isopenicillin N synthase family dioxygenase n=1 Tax=unclassified Pseudofrankia TaxID=2994372 RepID=UPI000A9E8B28|nr:MULTISPECIES: 2OG-Fe(II) oxygenase family protein [unclassified Pseudofrankia]MDT3442455.1 2OG-Fe(II) oxygenase family protein [Pseudofrankia sp. BMG5.37]
MPTAPVLSDHVARKAGHMSQIPVVNLGPALTGASAGAGAAPVVAELRRALADVGFLQVVGHGVPAALVDAAYATMDQVAALPDDERRALVRPRASQRGLFEQIDGQGRVLNRALQFITYDDLTAAEADGAVGGHPDYFVPNVWPEQLPGFKATWQRYAEATRELARTLMSLFAQALELPADYFAAPFAKDVTLFSANFYPPQPADADHEDVLLVAHADSGGLTVLHQRGDYEGLQLRGLDGEWITVPVRADAFVINIGHLLSRWTNGRYPATVHRVVAGPAPADQRQSIATFFLPNVDTVVTPVPTMVGAEGSRFEPITAYDWQRQFMEKYVLTKTYAEPATA